MTVSITRCCKKWPEFFRALLLCAAVATAHAGSIEPLSAALTPGEDGHTLSAEFSVDLGARLEEAVTRGVPLHLNLEFTLERVRWYWLNEHVATVTVNYRLSYNALTRQYRLSAGGLHQSFATLSEALRVISRVAALPVVDKGVLKNGETYAVALRLSHDRSQLPKPLQIDAIANKDWQVDAKALRWQFHQNEAAGGAK